MTDFEVSLENEKQEMEDIESKNEEIDKNLAHICSFQQAESKQLEEEKKNSTVENMMT
jgi:hypothetical protein